MKVSVFDQKNNKAGTIELPETIFKIKWNPSLVHQAFVAQISNERKNLAHTKGRGDVRGGGRKPRPQKGSGRSRQSSIRSPLWAGGGVTFGPTKERDFSKKINKKMKRLAIYSALSKKMADEEIKIIENLNLTDYKTKNLASVIKNFFKVRPSILIIPAKENKNIFLAGRNLPKVKILSSETLNIYDCVNYQYIFFEKAGVSELIERCSKSIK
ncbi:MAG: 50S ribosomal protein L4 [Patescibacteria group bacterium]